MTDPQSSDVAPSHDLPGDEIYNRIREAILRNRLGPGTKLAEVKLCELFGANRETVRRVLIRLASDSVVEYYPKRGAFVASPTREQVVHVRDARIAIEPDLVAGLAPTISDQRLAVLEETLRTQVASHDEADYGVAVEMSGEFHVQIAEFSGNPFCRKYMLELTALTCLAIAKFDVPAHDGCRLDDHFEIAEALRRREADEASAAMVRHLRLVHQAIIDRSSRPVPRHDLSGLATGDHSGVEVS